MKTQLQYLVLLLSLPLLSHAQTLDAPVAEGVYGGRIQSVTSYPLNSDSSRVIISTESANSLFYADAQTHNIASLTAIGSFNPVPGADIDDGFGVSIRNLAAHEASGTVYFISNAQLYTIDPTGGSATSVSTSVEDVLVEGNTLLYLEGSDLHFGTLNSSGTFTPHSTSPIAYTSGTGAGRAHLNLNPLTGEVVIFTEGSTAQFFKSSTSLSAVSSATVFTNLSYTTATGIEYRTFGIAPDGTYFLMGNHYPSGSSNSDYKVTARSSDAGLTWSHYSFDHPMGGGHSGLVGPNIDFAVQGTGYIVYNGKKYNDAAGDSLGWKEFGVPGGRARGYHPNDGVVWADPNNDSVVYFTTDVALGYSSNYGVTANPMNTGITAVQVYDMDMTSDYSTGWVASKSGIRKVSNYKTSAQWSPTQFPNNDGSPFNAIDMANDDTNTVYAGNVRIYKTTNGGSSWSLLFDPGAPSGGSVFSQVSTFCSSIEVNPYNTNVIMASFADMHNSDGGLFYSTDAGANWSQILVKSSSSGPDVDIFDVVFTDSNIAYVGAFYDLATPTGRSVYTVDISGSSPVVTQDMDASGTASGSLIVASIFDLEVSPSGDTVFAAGTDAGINHPICYFKDLSGAAKWEVISTSGFPTGSNQTASAVTIGDGIVFCAVNNEIYTYDLSVGGSWTLGYSYPTGTAINFLFYDELLVGTGTGLYAQDLNNTIGIDNIIRRDASLIADVFPNPSKHYVRIALRDKNKHIGNIQIMDMTGRIFPLVISEQNENEVLLNIKHLRSGIYLVDMTVDQHHYKQRLVKQ